jgi:hypothetical protein
MKKALLALGMMVVAGQSSAMYWVGNGVVGGYGGYCGQIFYGNGSGMGVMTRTMEACQTQLQNLISQYSNITAVEACHSCGRIFTNLPETGIVAAPGGTGAGPDRETVQHFLDQTQRLREEFRVDDYERAQRELQRAFQPEPKP